MRKAIVHVAVVAAGLAGCVLAGCKSDDAPPPARPVSLMLYCGAGIRPAGDALIRAFQADHNVRIAVTYGGSGRQLAQIASLPTGDLFMPGAEFYVDTAIEKGLAAAETKRIVAWFVPVIFVAKGNPKAVRTLADLRRKDVRVGLGDERACAVGKKSLKILAKAGIDREEVNVVYKSGTVNELGLAVQFRNVDAVILWDANARHFAEYGEAIAIPPEHNVLSPIPIAVLKSSKHPAEARLFIDFVTSMEGRLIFTEKGYAVSPPSQGGGR